MLQLEELTGTSGLNIKTKVGGSWVTPIPHANIGGTWTRVKKAYGKAGSTWQLTYEYESVYTLTSTTHTNVDLDTLGLDRYHNVRIVIPSGATLIASSTGNYALRTGTSHNAKLTIQNAGKILGRGGNGGRGGLSGSGGNAGPAGGAGSSGGPSVYIESAVTIINTGTIVGGGGGSGGGGSGGGRSGFPSYANYYAGGGGGGGGAPYGAGGAQGSGSEGRTGSAGGAGSLTSAGGGGAGSCHSQGCGSAGATGGAYGTNGSTAASGTGSFASGGGSGGSAGATYYNPSSYTIS